MISPSVEMTRLGFCDEVLFKSCEVVRLRELLFFLLFNDYAVYCVISTKGEITYRLASYARPILGYLFNVISPFVEMTRLGVCDEVLNL